MTVILCPNHKNWKSFFLNETKMSCLSRHLLDEWTLPHFMTGFYLRSNLKKINFKVIIFIGILWEIFERSIIATKFFAIFGPIVGVEGDSYEGDSLINSITDILVYLYGWKLANSYEKIDNKKIIN